MKLSLEVGEDLNGYLDVEIEEDASIEELYRICSAKYGEPVEVLMVKGQCGDDEALEKDKMDSLKDVGLQNGDRLIAQICGEPTTSVAKEAEVLQSNNRKPSTIHDMYEAASNDDAPLIFSLYEQDQIPYSSLLYGYTPLHAAARKNSSAAVEALLKLGENPLILSSDGHTPYHYAWATRGFAAQKMLAQNGGKTEDCSVM
eukprot:TRINITY_DN4596_c0_g1_i1.p1 TRINITY_DN4596_c0_g1~~TRINITY_DN4596_c0_g1_i1.p1  ORF type:complete len:201 (+),score=35.29 TRINITY_DN4596_c0_g1_i1:111-713(+)